MTSLIKTPFANFGDKNTVPEEDPSGGVNMTQGYGQAYSLDPNNNPSARRIEREMMNGLFNLVTRAIQEIQVSGVAPFITSDDNGGSAFSYGAGVVVLYENAIYQSLKADNTDLPTVAGSWSPIVSIDTGGKLYLQILNNLSEIAAAGAAAQSTARDNLNAVSKATTVNGHPLSGNINVTSQDIFSTQAIGLTADIDLNTLTTPGIYYNPANASATPEHNYPSTNAGSLVVLKDAGTTQIYTEYSGGYQYRRGYYGDAWGNWLHVYDSVHAPPAIDAYTKSESDGRYPLKDGASYVGFQSGDAEKPYFRHIASNAVVGLATTSYAYSKAESDERYAAAGASGSTTTGTTSAYYKHASGQIFMQCISGVASNSNTNPDVTITLPASFANGILAVGASFSGNGGDDADSWWTVGTSGKNQLNLHTRNCSGTWSFVVTGY